MNHLRLPVTQTDSVGALCVTLVLFRCLRITKAATIAATANRAVAETIVAVVRLLPPLRIESGPPRPLVVSRIPTVPLPVPPLLFAAGAADAEDSLGTLLGVSLGAKLGWSDGALLGSVLGLLLGESEAVVVSISTGVMLGTVLGASLKVSLPGDKSGVLVHFGHCGIGPARGMEVSICNDRTLGYRNNSSECDLSARPSTVVAKPLPLLTVAHRPPLPCDGIRARWPREANVCRAPHPRHMEARSSTRVRATRSRTACFSYKC
jgi:hypothetical protein